MTRKGIYPMVHGINCAICYPDGTAESYQKDAPHPEFRPMRGQAYVRKDQRDLNREIVHKSGLIIPATARHPRDEQNHRGRVLKLGPPCRTVQGVEVPWGFNEGDEVIYIYAAQVVERNRTIEDWIVVAQEEILGVVE